MIGIGKAIGFSVPPRVDLNLSARGDKSSSRQKKRPRAQEDADNGSSGDHLFHSQLEKIILLMLQILLTTSQMFLRWVKEECLHVLGTRLQCRQSVRQESSWGQKTVRAIT